MTAAITSIQSHIPAVVVFGLDETGKAHASTFGEAEASLARKAAALMGMSVMPIASDADRALAAKLPKGKIFASGKGFVPFVKAGVYSEIAAAAPRASSSDPPQSDHTSDALNDAPPSAQVPNEPQPETVSQPTNWHDIKVGSIVLSAAFPGEMDWYECVVVAAANGDDQFELRYCNWPNEPTFARKISEIGLLHPLFTPEPPLPMG